MIKTLLVIVAFVLNSAASAGSSLTVILSGETHGMIYTGSQSLSTFWRDFLKWSGIFGLWEQFGRDL